MHLGKDGSADIEPVKKHFYKISKTTAEQVEFFENVRRFEGEMKNDPTFGKYLATLADVYVNDAFSVSHREHASVVGAPKHLPSYAGLHLAEEVKNLSNALDNPKKPFLFILGGAKFSTKLPLIKKYLKVASTVFVGGALANDFLKAKGYEVGKSLTDDSDYDMEEILKEHVFARKKDKLILPVDVVVRNRSGVATKKSYEIGKTDTIVDIGSESIAELREQIKNSKLILWNGPLGKYESGGDFATKELLKEVLSTKAKVIIGGGDIVSVLSELYPGKEDFGKNVFVSTGGGAMLDFLAKGTLPGIKAIN